MESLGRYRDRPAAFDKSTAPGLLLPPPRTGRYFVRIDRSPFRKSKRFHMDLTVVSWNVNSIRVRLDGLARMDAALKPDIVCLQETKVADPQFPLEAVRELGFEHILINGVKGYGGVAILSRQPFTWTGTRDWCGRIDARHAAARIDAGPGLGEIEVHSLYVPAGGDIPDPEANPKFAHKLAFLDELRDWSAGLAGTARRILLTGDLNVAPLETDVWSHKRLLRVVTHTPIEVEKLNAAREAGKWTDVMREFVPPSERLYTWWSYRARDWQAANRGRRLDHIWTTPALKPHLAGIEVLEMARGWERPSDHVPVALGLNGQGALKGRGQSGRR